MFVQDEAPSITYLGSPYTLTKDTPVSGIVPENVGGVVEEWSIIFGTLPDGVNFDDTNGEITGTPVDVTTSTIVVTIRANNTAGESLVTVQIDVQDQVPEIAYVPDDVTLLNASSELEMVPIISGGQIGVWSISPEPSTGLMFDTSTGIFSGIPTETMVRTEYQITATNGVGSDVLSINITVEEFDYSLPLSPIYLVENAEMQSIEPTSTIPGAVYETSPQLPDGVFIGENNGTIWGTPSDGYPLTPFTIYANSSLLNGVVELQIGVLDDSDGDGMPNQLPNDYASSGELIEDTDDDDDTFSDLRETECGTDPLDATSVVTDLDGDSICDELDDDIDGDGLLNDVETDTSTYLNENDTGTDSMNADSDGDGVCDGPSVPINGGCIAGSDAFPNDPSAYTDTDGDGMPDEIIGDSTSQPPLTVDSDDDGDDWSDEDEAACGTDSLDDLSVPLDDDGDGICNALDNVVDLEFTLTYPTDSLNLTMNEEMSMLMPNITGLGEVATWEISDELPAGLVFGWSPARDGHLDGSISGTPTELIDSTEFTIWANNTAHSESHIITITVNDIVDVLPSNNIEEDDESVLDWRYLCLPLLLLVIVLIFAIYYASKEDEILDAEPENTIAEPKFSEGSGTKANPYILVAKTSVKPGQKVSSEELITIRKITPGLNLQLTDTSEHDKSGKFGMVDSKTDNQSVTMIQADDEGVVKFRVTFDDSHNPSIGGGDFNSQLKVGRESVYLSWSVQVEAESKSKKSESDSESTKEAKKQEELARIKSRAASIDFATLGVATVEAKDNLQSIKGVGPFIEEKLNALGIYTFTQVGNMTPKIEEEVNKAIEFFPGRVKRDEWAKQAKEFAKE